MFLFSLQRCVDCDAPYPQWATVSYGTFMCLECSGRHRGLGVHISFVRSVTMDSWTDKQVLIMLKGGNDSFRSAFSSAGVPTDLSITEKYNTPQAESYRHQLAAIVENRAPSPLPKWEFDMPCPASTTLSSSHADGVSLEGDKCGVEALKGESEQGYVTRQMKLREEARARMAAKFGENGMQGIGNNGETCAPQSGNLGDFSGALSYLTNTVATAASSAVNIVKDRELKTKVSSGWSYLQSAIHDPALSESVKSSATSGWSLLSSSASSLLQSAHSAVSGRDDHGDLDEMSSFPRTNPDFFAASNDSERSSTINSNRDYNSASWLDSQPIDGSKNSIISSYTSIQQPNASPTTHLSSRKANKTSCDLVGLSLLPVSTASNKNGLASAVAPPVPVVHEAKKSQKNVDFFGEFGF